MSNTSNPTEIPVPAKPPEIIPQKEPSQPMSPQEDPAGYPMENPDLPSPEELPRPQTSEDW
ncbi:hypothetical protein [Mucilaginibacter aquariorum]|uniref:Filamentous hemagglutinin n=1 Tax=Mucilaginibacter aquariorum TaxID=2967225 RepID=A0ABT1T3G9_9SPHI|nr:hypothetical protein [Mucilaginibacter aquariorum]MCQ6959162.1 hypothetical protein [Mucilaginibacter aquariorum]